jgi:hypothetical protein
MNATIFDVMDRNGMLPAHNCKQCDKPLNADGYHPAELYAGTYTGLCYQCERTGKRLIKIDPVDGAETWEFPPHCPSWRRDRERFIGFTGCQACNGKGRLWVSRANSQGGSYSAQCKECSERYWTHPLRLWESARWGTIRKAAEADYHRDLKRLKLWGKAKKGTIPADELQGIQAPFLARMDKVRERFAHLANKRLMRTERG